MKKLLLNLITVLIVFIYVTDTFSLNACQNAYALRPPSMTVSSENSESKSTHNKLYRKYVSVEGSSPYKLDIDYSSIDKKSLLYKLWAQKVKKERKAYFYQQRIGIRRKTFIGIASDGKIIAERFFDSLLSKAVLWKAMLREDLLFIITDKNRVDVYSGKSLKLSPLLSEIATNVLKDTDNVHKENVKDKDNDLSLSFKIADTKKDLTIQGTIEEQECQALAHALKSDYADLLKILGTTAITLRDRRIVIDSENEDINAQKTLREFIDGFTAIVSFSDIHAGKKGLEDTFGKEKEEILIKVLKRAVKRRSRVVINGDFLDLWVEKYSDIKRAYNKLFKVLRDVRRVIYVAGNHDWGIVSDSPKAELLKVAKSNIVKNMHKQQMLHELINHSSVRKKKRKLAKDVPSAQFVLSSGFREVGIVRDRNIFYIDDRIVDYLEDMDNRVSAEVLARTLFRLIEDLNEDLSNNIKQDLPNTEIVRYYEDRYLKVRFEHGHFSDPYNYQSITGHIVSMIANRLAKMGVKQFMLDVENRLIYQTVSFISRLYPPIMVKIIYNYVQRALAVAAVICRKYRDDQGKKWIIFFGHSHFPYYAGTGPVNDVIDYFYGILYGNTGAWTIRREKRRKGLIKQEEAMDWYDISSSGIRLMHGNPEDNTDIEFTETKTSSAGANSSLKKPHQVKISTLPLVGLTIDLKKKTDSQQVSSDLAQPVYGSSQSLKTLALIDRAA
jgi:predicted MPP superfamily phosphohydrolase